VVFVLALLLYYRVGILATDTARTIFEIKLPVPGYAYKLYPVHDTVVVLVVLVVILIVLVVFVQMSLVHQFQMIVPRVQCAVTLFIP
jgi:hypothetical protein